MRKLAVLLLTLGIAACGQAAKEPSDSGATEAPAAAPAVTVDYAAAVLNPARPEADRSRDAQRKPAEVLEFFGIEPGMVVLDMFSGGGYYTEILAHVVGDDGRVYAHSNEAYLAYVGDEFDQRYAEDRLGNVEILMAENNELSLAPGSLDAVMLVLSFHDLYFAAPDDGWPAFDIPAFLGELWSGLKPGGIVGIVDHYAEAGASSATGGTVHRIDPAIVVDAMEAAGFVLDGQSDVLRNPQDDYSRIVFDPELRGRTDRFVLRFRKPE